MISLSVEFSSSVSLIASVLLLTGFVAQHNGIKISSVPLFVTSFLSIVVSIMREPESYPSNAHPTEMLVFNPPINARHILPVLKTNPMAIDYITF